MKSQFETRMHFPKASSGAKYFTELDLRGTYKMAQIHSGNEWKDILSIQLCFYFMNAPFLLLLLAYA